MSLCVYSKKIEHAALQQLAYITQLPEGPGIW